MSSTTVRRIVKATRMAVYGAFVEAKAVATSMAPKGMTAEVHEMEAREGGRFRVTLRYQEASGTGKTTGDSDSYHGRFVKLVPGEEIVEVVEFETEDPGMKGESRITVKLSDVDDGTEIEATHDDLPPGLSAADNELGWKMSLEKLATMLEGR